MRHFHNAAMLMFWVSLCVWAGEAAPKPPFTGEVTGDRVYIRAGGGANYSVLTHAERGQRVEVRDQKFGWLQIPVPPTCTVWVRKDMLTPDADGKQATVAKDRVNIRARPALSGDAMGQLDKGARVKLVDSDGDWLGIAPPAQAMAWVHGDYVRKSSATVGEPQPKAKAVAATDTAATTALLRKAQELYQAELAKPAGKRDFADALTAYQRAASTSGDLDVAARAERARQRLLKIADLHQALQAAREPLDEFEKRYKSMEEEYMRRAVEASKQGSQ